MPPNRFKPWLLPRTHRILCWGSGRRPPRTPSWCLQLLASTPVPSEIQRPHGWDQTKDGDSKRWRLLVGSKRDTKNPEIADGYWCLQMPKQKQNLEIADGFWCSPSITEMDYRGEYIKYYNNLSIIQSFLICILKLYAFAYLRQICNCSQPYSEGPACTYCFEVCIGVLIYLQIYRYRYIYM